MRAGIFRTSCIALLCASVLGCQTAAQKRTIAGLEHIGDLNAAAERSLEAGDYPRAIRQWERALESLDGEDEAYLDNRLYLLESKILSGIGWANLAMGQPRLAGPFYRRAIEVIRAGHARHERLLRRRTRNEEAMLTALSVLSHSAATADMARAGYTTADMQRLNPFYNPIPQTIDLPDPVLELPGVTLAGKSVDRHVVRIPVVPDRGPLLRVGKLTAGSSWCTASLVGPRVVLTNAHCVTHVDDGCTYAPPRAPHDLAFRLEKVRYAVKLRVRTFFTAQGERGGWQCKKWQDDWALVVVDLPPDVRLGYLGVMVASPQELVNRDSSLIVAGYSGDQNEGRFMTMHWGCSPLSARDREATLQYSCSTWKGSSGAPIFLRNPSGWVVIGVNAFGNRPDHDDRYSAHVQGFAGGVLARQFAPTLARLRQEYPY